ncbi:transposase [Escherichia coli O45:H2 str. 2010C-4211]|nr:transposase [Escherichia coli O45:H2 str. 2010C-4211]
MWLAIQAASQKWTMPLRDWRMAYRHQKNFRHDIMPMPEVPFAPRLYL